MQNSSTASSRRILLIDDEEVVMFGYTKVLAEPGVEVDCAQTLEAARRYIETRRYNAAISDLKLSNPAELEGLTCLRLLHSSQKWCVSLVLTACDEESVKNEVRSLGADLFFTKPVDPCLIREALASFGIYNK